MTKNDHEGIAEVISNRVSLGYETPEQMITEAKSIFDYLDCEVKAYEIALERLKARRAKFLDVISVLEKQSKKTPSKVTMSEVIVELGDPETWDTEDELYDLSIRKRSK